MDPMVDTLARLNLFEGLSHKHLKRIVPLLEVREVKEGEEIVREGSHGRDFYIVLEGAARVSVRGRDRDSIGKGEVFGEIAVLARSSRSATVRATAPMKLAVIDSTAFWQLLEDEPLIGLHLLEIIARRYEALSMKPAGTFR